MPKIGSVLDEPLNTIEIACNRAYEEKTAALKTIVELNERIVILDIQIKGYYHAHDILMVEYRSKS